jgi:hypothetical protein
LEHASWCIALLLASPVAIGQVAAWTLRFGWATIGLDAAEGLGQDGTEVWEQGNALALALVRVSACRRMHRAYRVVGGLG